MSVAHEYDQLAGLRRADATKNVRALNNVAKNMLIQYSTKLSQLAGSRGPFSVLDIACGQGGDLLKWEHVFGEYSIAHEETGGGKRGRERDIVYTGVDISERSVEVARERARRSTMSCKHAVCDATRDPLPLPAESVDVASMQMAFHYAADQERSMDHLCSEVSRVLRVGGVFVCTFMDGRVAVTEPGLVEVGIVPPGEGFGSRYSVRMEGSVQSDEFSVPVRATTEIASRHQLQLVRCERLTTTLESMSVAHPHIVEHLLQLSKAEEDEAAIRVVSMYRCMVWIKRP